MTARAAVEELNRARMLVPFHRQVELSVLLAKRAAEQDPDAVTFMRLLHWHGPTAMH